jgi:DNA repair exonuclease SbcCD ATPase subunit
VSGFRGFGASVSFDLDADAVVIVGANGQGKTSLFDAVLWALAGEIDRLDTKDDGLMSLYSPDGQMHVEVILSADDGTRRRIVREFDRSSNTASILWDDGEGLPKRGLAANSELLAQLWPAALEAKDASQSFGMALTRANYLQQDRLSQFIGADSDDSRFAVLAELLGAGRLRELTLALESAQKSYTTTTNQFTAQLRQLVDREEQLASGLAELAVAVDVDALATRWHAWWSEFRVVGGTGEEPSDFRAAAASSHLDAAARELSARRDVSDRRRNEAEALFVRYTEFLGELNAHSEGPELDALRRSNRDDAQADLLRLQQLLVDAQQRAEQRRADALAQTEAREELSALAQLALRHLNGPCPVCEQPHDVEATRRHLESLISPDIVMDAQAGEQIDEVAENQTQIAQARTRLATLETEIEEDDRRREAQRRMLEELDATLERFGQASQPPDTVLVALRAEAEQMAEQLSRIERLLGEVETLTLDVARLAAQARRAELEREMLEVRASISDRQRSARVREEARSLSGRIIDGLRVSTEAFVDERLKSMAPLLQAIYDSIDPHPTLQNVRLLSRMFGGRGRLDAEVSDPDQPRVLTTSPPLILSSSQSNALAVAIFLTLNLTTPNAPLASLLMDDPLQSLDRINLLGLVDVLRRTAPTRQLIVATHDDAFGQLLARKLRPARQGSRTIVIRLGGWSRSGPTVEMSSIEPDLGRLVS